MSSVLVCTYWVAGGDLMRALFGQYLSCVYHPSLFPGIVIINHMSNVFIQDS